VAWSSWSAARLASTALAFRSMIPPPHYPPCSAFLILATARFAASLRISRSVSVVPPTAGWPSS
jgi:hypothetical protein